MFIAHRPSSIAMPVVPLRQVVGELAAVHLGLDLVRDQLVSTNARARSWIRGPRPTWGRSSRARLYEMNSSRSRLSSICRSESGSTEWSRSGELGLSGGSPNSSPER